jgi:FkbM family methyltransferase
MAAVFGAARIIAMEPNPIAYARLMFNISANGFNDRILALPLALGERNEKTTLFIAKGDMGGSRISQSEIPGTPIAVSIKPLAAVLAEERIDRVDAMKIDVEGMEDSILFPFYESTPFNMWPRIVIIEPSQKQWKRDILSRMLEIGYKIMGSTRSNIMLRLREFKTTP